MKYFHETIRPEDVTSQENKVYSKIVNANILDCFELETLTNYTRQRIGLEKEITELKDKLNTVNYQLKDELPLNLTIREQNIIEILNRE